MLANGNISSRDLLFVCPFKNVHPSNVHPGTVLVLLVSIISYGSWSTRRVTLSKTFQVLTASTFWLPQMVHVHVWLQHRQGCISDRLCFSFTEISFKVFDFIFKVCHGFNSPCIEVEGTVPTASHGLAHMEGDAMLADCSLGLAGLRAPWEEHLVLHGSSPGFQGGVDDDPPCHNHCGDSHKIWWTSPHSALNTRFSPSAGLWHKTHL